VFSLSRLRSAFLFREWHRRGNGNGPYNIPIWEYNPLPGVQTGNGTGDLPGGVIFGLFQAGSTTPLPTVMLRTDAVHAGQGPSLAAAKLGGLQFMDETADAPGISVLNGFGGGGGVRN
jgi:hypothetical protein